jgi:threonine/homoserine/homoserine lactone efflux protein
VFIGNVSVSVQPRPANIVAFLPGAQAGLKRSVPLFLGIDIAYFAYSLLMGFGLAKLIAMYPALVP